MSNYKLRSLCIEDLDRVTDIDGRLAGTTRKPFFKKLIASVLANPAGFITCAAEDGGKLVGFGAARIQAGEFGSNDTVAVIDLIGVDPDAQGKGIGAAVLSGIEQRSKVKGVDTLKTQVMWADSTLSGFLCRNGFKLASSQIIERDTSLLKEHVTEVTPVQMDSKWQVHSSPGGNDYDMLSRDKVLVRSFRADDLPAVVRIDGKLTGQDRAAYYEAKSREMLEESGIRVSLVSEDDGIISGFIMARVDYGEFGKVGSEAVLDTIGVHPAYAGMGVGHALLSQLLLNLSNLKVDSVRTQVLWENFSLQRFLHGCGFGPSQRLVLVKTVG